MSSSAVYVCRQYHNTTMLNMIMVMCCSVVSVGLVWESAKSGGQHIRDVVNYCIGTSLDLTEVSPSHFQWQINRNIGMDDGQQ